MKNVIQELLISVIEKSLRELKLPCKEQFIYLDLPQDERFGDLSTNIALKLCRLQKKSPLEIAKILAETIKGISGDEPGLKNYIKEIKAEGKGFINFYFKEQFFYEQLREVILKGPGYFKVDSGKKKRVLIEFVSANPTGSLSVAHARQAAVGDVLANILEFLGFEAKREYYLNDEGNQINILGKSVELRIKELNGEKIEFPQDYYQGDYIYDIARKAQAENITSQDLSDYASGYILGIIKKELVDFGVKFDYWYSQKELRQSGKIDETLDSLKKKKLVYEKDGALWFKSTEFGDDKDRVVIKSDSTYTYLAPDIAYHEEKYRRGFNLLINLWGPDHHGYINRLKASVEALGHEPQTLTVIIVQLATIFRGGTPVQMSTRKGQYITLREVLDEVGPDASRFFFLMRRTSAHLDFDLDVAKKESSENPVYYVQYAYARICSILRANPALIKKDADLSVLKEKEEIGLIKKALQFPYILNICLNTQDPYMVTVYLQALAESFHKFYDRHRVLGDDDSLTQARLMLIEAVKIVIAAGLDLLGVSKPEKM